MKEIVVCYILSLFVIVFGGLIYTNFNIGNIDQFLEFPAIILIIIYEVLVILYLFFKHRRKEKSIHWCDGFFLISFGISIAIILNMVIFFINSPSSSGSFSSFFLFLSSGVIGPIYEEIIFRYVFYHQLRCKYSKKKSIIINAFVFGLFHFNIIKSIYAFIFGVFLLLVYEKKKNIFAPILVHIAGNSIVLFLSGFNLVILLLAIINFFITSYIIFGVTKNS